ncbi:MAG: CPBP family intramembrane glutamic endopeptidase [Planctomycetota bacterium]|jgi:membrane protease YdiL (CAAX protease family)
MIDPTIADHILAAVLAAVAVYGMIRGQGSMKGSTLDTRDKLQIYWLNGAFLCAMAGVTLWIWTSADRSLASIGLTWAHTSLGVALLITAAFVIWNVFEADLWSETRRMRQLARLRGDAPFLPGTAREARHFMILGTAAGVTEEIIFRGFGILYLQSFTGDSFLGVAIAVALPGIVFAVAHRYQGWKAVSKIVILAIAFGAIFVITGSLVIPIILHIAVDVIGGWMGWLLTREERERGGAVVQAVSC